MDDNENNNTHREILADSEFENHQNNNKMKKAASTMSLTTPINPLADLMYKKHTRNQLINLLEESDNENKTLKRQLNSKFFILVYFIA